MVTFNQGMVNLGLAAAAPITGGLSLRSWKRNDGGSGVDPSQIASMLVAQNQINQQERDREALAAEQARIAARKNAQRQTVEQLYADTTDIDANDRAIDARLKANADQGARDYVTAGNRMEYANQATGQAGSTVAANHAATASDAYARMLAQWNAASAAGKQQYRDSRTANKGRLMGVVNQGDDLSNDAFNQYLGAVNGQLGDQAATQTALAQVDAAGQSGHDALSQLIGSLAQGGATGVNQWYNRQPAPRTKQTNTFVEL